MEREVVGNRAGLMPLLGVPVTRVARALGFRYLTA